MANARIVVHIGYPKCMSTTLQRDFFSKHPEINYLGVGFADNMSYSTNEVEYLNETFLKYCRDDLWERSKLDFHHHLKKLIDYQKTTVFSNEHLSLKFFPLLREDFSSPA